MTSMLVSAKRLPGEVYRSAPLNVASFLSRSWSGGRFVLTSGEAM